MAAMAVPDRPPPVLTEEDVYNFDTAGWVHLRGVLSTAEQVAAASALDLGTPGGGEDTAVAAGTPMIRGITAERRANDVPHSACHGDDDAATAAARVLVELPALRARLVQLVAGLPASAHKDSQLPAQGAPLRDDGSLTLQMNGPAIEVPSLADEALVGGPGAGGVIDTARSYLYESGHRYVHGLVVVCAVSDVGEGSGGYAVVSGSHKGTLEVPAAIRSGDASPLANLGILRQPPLAGGDVLLISSAALHGARGAAPEGRAGPRLLRCELLSGMARLHGSVERHDIEREAEWMGDLTPIERLVMGLDPQHRSPGDGHPTVRATDGKVWLEDRNGEEYHPGVLGPALDFPSRQAEEMYLWDTCGYLILRGVMDAAWIAAAIAANDWSQSNPDREGMAAEMGPMGLPQPHCLPFRRMVAHPTVLERLEWIFGTGYVHYGPAGVRQTDIGNGGQRIHAGLMDRDCDYHYIKIINGRSYCASLNVSWQLADHCPHGGGLHVVPGSRECQRTDITHVHCTY